jgi:hypothetical protein
MIPKNHGSRRLIVGLGTGFLVAASWSSFVEAAPDTSEIRYGRDIRPILSDRCFLCHGPDRATRKAGLRLDSFESATSDLGGYAAIVPGDPDRSLLMQLVAHEDVDERMPPQDSGKRSLAPDQVDIVRRWIEQGAVYEKHWAFEPPVAPEVPQVIADDWSRNDIDRFILEKLESRSLQPNEQADPETLARRLYLDVTGLPPTPEEMRAHLDDSSAGAYERLVDRLFTEEPYRTRHAERMTTPWLDLARYADTSGIHMDAGRSIWLYRDWVINAFKQNLPFDRFIVHQIAGDLVPEATVDQIVASGFNRNHVTSDEGGAINEEYLLEYAVDRANTTGEVFLGLTVGCARCHDHKFDPITAEDYYSLIAFFNNNEEPGIYSQVPDPYRALEPYIEVPQPEDRERIEQLEGVLSALRAERETPTAEESEQIAPFVEALRSNGNWRWETPRVRTAVSEAGVELTAQPDGSVLAGGANPAADVQTFTLETESTGLRSIMLEALDDPTLPQGRVGRAANGNAVLRGISAEVVSRADPTLRRQLDFTWAWADVEQEEGDFRVTNALRSDDDRVWAVAAHLIPGGRNALFVTREPFGFEGGSDIVVRLDYDTSYAEHTFGRTRLRVGTADESALDRLPHATTNWYITGPFLTSDGEEAYTTAFGPEEAGPLAFGKRYGPFQWRHAPGVAEAQPVTLAQGIGAEYIGREIYAPTARNLELSLGSDDGIQVYHNGTLVHERRINRGVAPDQDQVTLSLQPGLNTLVCKVVNTGGAGGIYHRATADPNEMPHDAVFFVFPEDRLNPARLARANDAWRSMYSPRFLELTSQLQTAESEYQSVVKRIPRTMVMKDRAMPRDTYVMNRGQYDQPDLNRKVFTAIPVMLGSLKSASANRLDLAEWLVGDENPLTARVVVNRYWELLFGRGLVETSNDFGMQGSWPTHPELLDHLAVDFRDNGWNHDRLMRMLLTSATYRQRSTVNPEARAVDPDNTLLGWYPRQRLTAEQIRDQALYVSGLLVERSGGASVKPYQPEGLWREVAMPSSNTREFSRSDGDGLWRRSLYTYWKRAAPPPSMLTLDAPTREYCAGTRRISTNTPLQALVLWNDVQFVEAARMVAERTLRQATTDRSRMELLHRRLAGDRPSLSAMQAMQEALVSYRVRYLASPEDAMKLIGVGESPVPDDIPASELASWTMLANALLASDAAIVKD